jgi:hypothetical protein
MKAASELARLGLARERSHVLDLTRNTEGANNQEAEQSNVSQNQARKKRETCFDF